MRRGLKFLPVGIFLAALIAVTFWSDALRKMAAVQVQAMPIGSGYLKNTAVFTRAEDADENAVYVGPADFGRCTLWNVHAFLDDEPLDCAVSFVDCGDDLCRVEISGIEKNINQITLQAQSNYKGILIPVSAISDGMVYLVKDMETAWGTKTVLCATYVFVGEEDHDNAEILDELHGDDRIVISDTSELSDGQVVVLE